MPDPTATAPGGDPGARPVRDGPRDSPAPHPALPDGHPAPGSRPPGQPCPVCRAPLASARARYCSHACRQHAYRLRALRTTTADVTVLAAELTRLGQRAAHTIYECPLCDQRYLGERRCPACNLFCRALGLGGVCPQCDEPILIADLLGTEVTTRS